MKSHNNDRDIIIIGAGFAGLAAGIYAQINGYRTQIFEMHNHPGGLCTAWKRKGYTIDGCIHWLVGSSPHSGMYHLWEEVGIARGREFINMDEYMRIEDTNGRELIFYTDVDKLEKHLLEFSPQDEKPIMEFIRGIRMCLPFDHASRLDSPLKKLYKKLKVVFTFMANGRKMQQWMKLTAEDFARQFKDHLLREAFLEMWVPEFSMFFMLFTFAYLHNKNAGYPIGGSRPMSQALEDRYLEIGGLVHYNKRVESILVENNNAVGIRLADGTEHRCGRVISAADGYTTIFKMLDGKYGDEKTREPYEKWPVFPPLIFVGLGVNRTFDDVTPSVSGLCYYLKQPVKIGDATRERLWVHIYNQDPTLAPAERTSLTLMMPTNYEYWKKLAHDKASYNQEKKEIGRTVVDLLEQRFPGIKSQTEVIDVATPLTFERYTGNWKGSFEGWLITPENSHVMMKPMSQTLSGLQNFYMCGQWVEPGGGLPTSVMSAERLIKKLCKEDHKKFRATQG